MEERVRGGGHCKVLLVGLSIESKSVRWSFPTFDRNREELVEDIIG